MSRNFDTRLQRLERKRAERDPVELRLVFLADLTPEEREALEAQPRDRRVIMSWAPEDEPIRIVLDA